MDFIQSKLNQKISYLLSLNQLEQAKIHFQSKLEYYLLLVLSYLWNKNWDNLSPEDKEFCIENILKPSIGSIVACSRRLDISNEIFGNKKEKDLSQAIDKYPCKLPRK